MNIAVLGGIALGAAALIVFAIVAPLGLLSSDAQVPETVAEAPSAPSPDAGAGSMAGGSMGIPAASAPKVFFANISDGAIVTAPVKLEFGMLGMNVSPAGEMIDGTGHHHLLIDKPLESVALDGPLPMDANHIHFGDGSTSTVLDLAPGTYRLQLLAADGNHIPHDPPVASAPITITVTETAPEPTPLFPLN
jgi:hypothetical protein